MNWRITQRLAKHQLRDILYEYFEHYDDFDADDPTKYTVELCKKYGIPVVELYNAVDEIKNQLIEYYFYDQKLLDELDNLELDND